MLPFDVEGNGMKHTEFCQLSININHEIVQPNKIVVNTEWWDIIEIRDVYGIK